jgi:hypothetical protein
VYKGAGLHVVQQAFSLKKTLIPFLIAPSTSGGGAGDHFSVRLPIYSETVSNRVQIVAEIALLLYVRLA